MAVTELVYGMFFIYAETSNHWTKFLKILDDKVISRLSSKCVSF